MDQKNTMVKCYAHPNCLFNHNGVCDNYVISIGEDGKCDCYVATATCQDCEFYEDKKLLQNRCAKDEHYYLRTAPTCDSFQEKVKRGQRAKSRVIDDSCNQCSSACEYYDFKGASLYCQLKQQYLGPEQLMKPCDLFKLFLPIADTKASITMKVTELNKPNKNQSIISDWDYAAKPDTCKTCKKVVYGQPCQHKNVINGVWTCYEEEIDEV